MIKTVTAILITEDERDKLLEERGKHNDGTSLSLLYPTCYQDHIFGIAVVQDDLTEFINELDAGCSSD